MRNFYVFGAGLFVVGAYLGALVGLRIKHRRFLAERRRCGELEAKVDMYDRNALRTDHDVAGPVTPKPRFHDIDPDEPFDDAELLGPELFAEMREQAADPFDFIGIRSGLPTPPLAMTGERDTDAQDRELAEVYGIEHDIVLGRPERPTVTLDGTVRVVHPEGVCPRCGENLTVLDDGALWCAECTSFWDRPCGWSADGADGVCGEPSEGHASWPGQDEVPLCGVHLAWMSENQGCPWAECPHPDRCDTGCRWGEEANRWAEVIHSEPLTDDDRDVQRSGFHGYEGCPSGECTTPFHCSERGDCRRWPEAVGVEDDPGDRLPRVLPEGRID